MALYASWTPGYTAKAQFTGPGMLLQVGGNAWSDIVGLREGFGATFRLLNGKGNWFHFAIPTPVIVNDQRAQLEKVYVLYTIDTWALIKGIAIWDGPKQLKSDFSLALSGEHSTGIDTANTFDGSHAPVQFGIGISLLIECSPGIDASIKFTSAGADFSI